MPAAKAEVMKLVCSTIRCDVLYAAFALLASSVAVFTLVHISVPDHVPSTTLSKPGIIFLVDNPYHVCPDIPFVIVGR